MTLDLREGRWELLGGGGGILLIDRKESSFFPRNEKLVLSPHLADPIPCYCSLLYLWDGHSLAK